MKERCREVLEQIYFYLDGEGLDASDRLHIKAHLEECRPCFERYGLEKEVGELIARLNGSCRCPEALKTRVLDLINHA